MANVLNRTTKEYLISVNTLDYLTPDWIVNPDVSAVAGQPTRFWRINGDIVSLMNQGEKDAVLLAEQTAGRDLLVAELDFAENVLRQVFAVILDEFNLHAAKTNAVLNAVDNASSFANMKTAIAAIPDFPARTFAQLRTAVRNKLGT